MRTFRVIEESTFHAEIEAAPGGYDLFRSFWGSTPLLSRHRPDATTCFDAWKAHAGRKRSKVFSFNITASFGSAFVVSCVCVFFFPNV